MPRLRLTGLVGSLVVVGVVLGGVVVLAGSLPGDVAATAVVGLVLLVALGLAAYGRASGPGATPYW